MAAIVDIINTALAELGQTRVSSRDAATPGAQAIDSVFDAELDLFLEEHPWNFAKARASLARTASTPLFGFQYAYALPADFFAVWQEERPDMLYRIEGGKLLCDEEEVQLVYIRRVTTANEMPATFRDALALRLAARVCRRVTGSDPGDKLLVRLDAAVRKSKFLNARNSGRQKPTRPDELMRARAGRRS